jgi:DNA-directed RNA polymerase subunit RPC12/RpoP
VIDKKGEINMPEKKKKKEKWKLELPIQCPGCKARLLVKVRDETITPAVPAEKEQIIKVEKDTQSTLEDAEEKP